MIRRENRKKQEIKKKVFVALSGGVDSSVAAALLKERGYDVTGVFMKNWSDERLSSCPYKEDRASAMRVAVALDIPFFTWDFENEYKKEVVDYMIREYKAGRTPNPDVMCNKKIKFGLFLSRALAEGADFIATGHYVRLAPKIVPQGRREKGLGERPKMVYHLFKAKDKNKDQSYFLWTLTQEQLRYCFFPLGELTKPEVRTLAARFELPTAERKDSQGVCFVGEIELKDFLANWIRPRKGNILTLDTNEPLGAHEGAEFYTIGQRHGLGIGGIQGNKEGDAYFVAKKDIAKNILYVVKGRNHPALFSRDVVVTNVNWIAGFPKRGAWYTARVRYRGELLLCRFDMASIGLAHRKEEVTLQFKKPQWAVASGQSAVFYDNEGEMMGGGVIQ